MFSNFCTCNAKERAANQSALFNDIIHQDRNTWYAIQFLTRMVLKQIVQTESNCISASQVLQQQLSGQPPGPAVVTAVDMHGELIRGVQGPHVTVLPITHSRQPQSLPCMQGCIPVVARQVGSCILIVANLYGIRPHIPGPLCNQQHPC